MRLISLVFPVYNEQEALPVLFKRLLRLKEKMKKYQVEMIFVNDGSQDDSFSILSEFAEKYPFVRVLNFSRNFGHQMAITAGMDYAEGDAVVVMDADLQDPPEVVPELIEKWEEGFEVVQAKRKTREDTLFKKFTAWMYYRLLQTMTEVKLQPDVGDFRLVDRRVIGELKKLRERNRYIRGLTSYVGFKQTGIEFEREARYAGETKYSLRKMLKFAWDGLTSFSAVPLKLSTYLGFFVAFLSLLGILYALFMYFFLPQVTVTGWTFMIISIFFIGGVQMIILGIMGEYIARIYSEVQDRPLYIVDEEINFE